MDAITHCRNHPEVTEGLRHCVACGESFCHDCLIDLSGEARCAGCKKERLRDLLSGVDSRPRTGPTIAVYSPIAVAAYGILLAFPSSLLLAIANWRAMGQQKRIKPHLLWFSLFSVVLSVVLVRVPQGARLFAFAANLLSFSYFRQKMKTDLAEYLAANPNADVVTKPWYRGLGRGLGGVVALFVVVILVMLALSPFG
jgi:hypothetical protein